MHISDSMDKFIQPSIQNRWLKSSKRDRHLLSAGHLCSDQSNWTLDKSLIKTMLYRFLLTEPTSLSKRTFYNLRKCARNGLWSDSVAFKNFSDENQLQLNSLWSDQVAPKTVYDQTQLLSKPFLIRLLRVGICLWSGLSDFERKMVRRALEGVWLGQFWAHTSSCGPVFSKA